MCHLTGKLITKNFMGKAVRGLIQGSLGKGKMVDGLLSNALVTKMVQKKMQGKAGLGTKMVLPSTPKQASLTWTAVPGFRVCYYVALQLQLQHKPQQVQTNSCDVQWYQITTVSGTQQTLMVLVISSCRLCLNCQRSGIAYALSHKAKHHIGHALPNRPLSITCFQRPLVLAYRLSA